jgi:DNA-binding transcriptional ArsR family regulator
MAGLGRPGLAKSDLRSELEQYERVARVGKMYFDDEMTTAEIAAITGYSQRQVQRHVRKAGDIVKQMYDESMGARVLQNDMWVLRGIHMYLDDVEDAGGVILPKDLPALTGMLRYLSEKVGQLGPKRNTVKLRARGDGSLVSESKGIVDDDLNLTLGLDTTMADGVRSGRSPEEQVVALQGAQEVIDALAVSDPVMNDDADDYDDAGSVDMDTSSPDDEPGRWKGGKWIPWWEDNPWHWIGEDEPEPDPMFYNGPTLNVTL